MSTNQKYQKDISSNWMQKTSESQTVIVCAIGVCVCVLFYKKVCVCVCVCVCVIRAGHFRYFLICSILKNDFIAFFIKLITYFSTNPI